MGAPFLLSHSYTIVYGNRSDRLLNGALDLFGIIYLVVPGAQKSMVHKISVVSAGEKNSINFHPKHIFTTPNKAGFLKIKKSGSGIPPIRVF